MASIDDIETSAEPEVVVAVETSAEPETAEPVDVSAEPEIVEGVEASIEPEPQPELAPEAQPEFETDPEFEPADQGSGGPGFSKLLEGIAQLTGFYGQGVKVDEADVHVAPPAPAEPESVEASVEAPEAVEPLELQEPVVADEPVAIEEPVAEAPEEVAAEEAAPEVVSAVATPKHSEPAPTPAMEGALQSKLTEVRAKADEARQAQLRAIQALHEGLSAAYDFALDAETSPEEYLRLVEAQGLKIQLRAPMAPVAKLAFDGVCDTSTIAQFEAVLAWALKAELPRGALLERIEQAGGIPELLSQG